MNFQEGFFTQYVEAVQQRTQELYSTVQETVEHPQSLVDCLYELRLALEELHVAEEELHQQNDTLIEAHQTIAAERKRYQELFEFAPDAYLITDLHGSIQEANRAASTLLNVPSHRLVRKPLITFIPEDQRRSFRSIVTQLPTLNRVQEWEIVISGRKSEPIEVAVTVETVRTNGEPTSLRWLIRDVTQRKRQEAQLQNIQLQNLQLVEADRIKDQFMATVSHELRTPMNAILGFSKLLLRQTGTREDPQLVNMVERIVRNSKHLLSLIEELLDFSKLKANRLELRSSGFDLVRVAQETIEELNSLAEQKGLALEIHSSQPELPLVNDPGRLRQILVNLLSNAIKFTDTGSVMLRLLDLPEGRVLISVQDTGVGIAPADQEKIFQEFCQVNQTSSRQASGTGLGLAIVYALVQLMQGTIAVESQLDRGTTFRIELPRRVESNEAD